MKELLLILSAIDRQGLYLIAGVDSSDIHVPNFAGALRPDAHDPIFSKIVAHVQAMGVEHCCSPNLFAGCGIV
jgi:hypothetical protein